MKLSTVILDLQVEGVEAVLNEEDAEELLVRPGDRILIEGDGDQLVAIAEVSRGMVEPGQVGILGSSGEMPGEVKVRSAPKLRSVDHIRKKMDGSKLDREEIRGIIEDVSAGRLSKVETTAFVCSTYMRTMDYDEVQWMTEAMVETGDRIEFEEGPIVDKHSIGGVPGNKITLLIVPIVAAAGLRIPKTSSRAITGAAGTADVMEVLAPVEFGVEDIKRLTLDVGGTIAWGGGTNIAPADDRIIEVEYPLSIDPKPQLLASVLAKKAAVGADDVVIDLPVGRGTKLPSEEDAPELAMDFIQLGRRLGMRVECVTSYGGSPVGRTIGPLLEAREALKVLEGSGHPRSLLEKSCEVAGVLLEMGGVAESGGGERRARELVESGAALEKMKEIIAAQGGDPDVTADGLELPRYSWEVRSGHGGYVTELDNRGLVAICRAAGAPRDEGAGVVLHKKVGDEVNRGEKVLTVYSESEAKLEEAKELFNREKPYRLEGMVLERYTEGGRS